MGHKISGAFHIFKKTLNTYCELGVLLQCYVKSGVLCDLAPPTVQHHCHKYTPQVCNNYTFLHVSYFQENYIKLHNVAFFRFKNKIIAANLGLLMKNSVFQCVILWL